MGLFSEYPYLNFSDYNLDWIIRTVKDNTELVNQLNIWKNQHNAEYNDLLNIVNTLKDNLVEPVKEWDATISYRIYSMVSYDGSNYIAIKDVPPGILLDNADYWLPANTVTAQLDAILATIYDLLNKSGDPLTVNSFENAVLHNIFHTPAAGHQISGIAKDDRYTYISYVSQSVGEIKGYVVKYSNADGSIISTLYDDIYHSNSITLIDNILYSADCLILTNNGYTPVSSIAVIDPETMTLTRRLITNLDASFTAVFSINNELYAMTAGGAIYQINTDTGIASYIKTLPFESVGITQGATYYDGKILYCRYNPNLIEIFDYDQNIKINNIQIGFTLPEAGTITELESVYVYNDNLYFIGTSSTGGDPCYRVQLNREAANGPKDRLGSYLSVMHVDGLPNTEDRIKNNLFEKPNDAVVRVKGFPGAKVRISIDTTTDCDLALEGTGDKSVTLITAGDAVFQGSVYLYDGDFTFNGRWLANKEHQIYLNTTNRLPSNIVLQGTITDAAAEHDFFSTNNNANSNLIIDLTMSGSSLANLIFNLQNGMKATFSARASYRIKQTAWSDLYSPGFHTITGSLSPNTKFRKTEVGLNLTADTTYDLSNLGISLSYGNRVILVTSIGNYGADYISSQSDVRNVGGLSGAAPVMIHIRLTATSIRVFKYSLVDGKWTADNSNVSVYQIIVI